MSWRILVWVYGTAFFAVLVLAILWCVSWFARYVPWDSA
jgi:hypothetical protein